MNLTSYILSIAGIALITAITEFIMPFGRMKTLAKTIFNLFLIVAMISPIFQHQLLFDFDYNKSDINVDSAAVDSIKNDREVYIENLCQNALIKEGIKGVKVDIVIDKSTVYLTVKKVAINFDNLVISDKNEHINITSKTIEILAKLLNIDEELILIE